MEAFGSTEFWDLRMSPGLVGTTGAVDIPLPDNVRRYYFPGTTHGGGSGGFSVVPPPPGARPRRSLCELPANPNPQFETMHALLEAMVDWVVKGTAPPPSQYPRLADGNLVRPTRAAVGFPDIPGVSLKDNFFENPLIDYDWGSTFNYNDVVGVLSKVPPNIKQVIQLLVPKVNADGNELGGVPSGAAIAGPARQHISDGTSFPAGSSKGRCAHLQGASSRLRRRKKNGSRQKIRARL